MAIVGKFTTTLIATLLLALPSLAKDDARLVLMEQALPHFRQDSHDVGNKGNRLLLMAVESSRPDAITRQEIAELGFQLPEGSEANLEPLYVLTANGHGISEVRSFLLPGVFERKGLPDRLFDFQKNKRGKLGQQNRTTLRNITKVISNLTIRKAIAGWRALSGDIEKAQRIDGARLVAILERAVLMPESVLGHEKLDVGELKQLAALTSVRFAAGGEFNTYLGTEQEIEDYFDVVLGKKIDNSSMRFARLITDSNLQKGLFVTPLWFNIAVVSLDCETADMNEISTLMQSVPDKDLLIGEIQQSCADGEQVFPLYMASLDNTKKPRPLIDFRNPEDKWQKKRGLFKKILGLPFLLANKSIEAVGGVVQAVKFGDHPRFDAPIKADPYYLELAKFTGLIQSGSVDWEMSDLMVRVFLSQLSYYSKKAALLPNEELADFEKGLLTKDPNEIERVMDRYMPRILEKLAGSRLIANSKERQARWMDFKQYLGDSKKLKKLGERLDKEELKTCNKIRAEEYKASRDPASTESRPLIVIMVDSLRPDRLKYFANQPNTRIPLLKKLFLDQAVEIPSYNTNANSSPSWTTIMTGFDPSETLVRATVTVSRDKAQFLGSLLDPRLSMKHKLFGAKTHPALVRVREMGLDWLKSNVAQDESIYPFTPVHDGEELPIFGYVVPSFAAAILGIQDKTFNDGDVWDYANTQRIVDAIKKDAKENKRLKLVFHYLGAMDHDAHRGVHTLDHAFLKMEENVSKIIHAAKDHPVLKNAVIMLLSDHGMTGGKEYVNPSRHFLPNESFFLKNTEFNLTRFFAGDYPGYEKYGFVVGTVSPAGPHLGSAGLMAPFSYNYYGKNKVAAVTPENLKERTMVVAQSGNAYSPVFVMEEGRNPAQRQSYFELSNYKGNNIPSDLLNLQLNNTASRFPLSGDKKMGLIEKLRGFNGLRPIGLFTMALQGENARKSADLLLPMKDGSESTEEPILVQARGSSAHIRSALILTKRQNGFDTHRYLIVDNFNQDQDGNVSGTISENVEDDPLWLPNMGLPTRSIHPNDAWLSDREWLKRSKNEYYPNAIAFLTRNFLLSDLAQKHPRRVVYERETPDFIVFSAQGFNFNQNEDNQGDHGGPSYEQSRTSFFVNTGAARSGVISPEPAMTRDIAPTILDYLGISSKTPNANGKSFRGLVEQLSQNQ